MALRVRLLGHFQISFDDELIVELSPRLQALIAYVALARGLPLSRRQAARDLWPDTDEKQALKNLRTQLARLRQALPRVDEIVLVTPETLQWRSDSGAVLDVAEFESAAQSAAAQPRASGPSATELCEHALRIYTGELLPAWYDEWLRLPRETLHSRYLATYELLAARLEEEQRFADAAAAAQRWLRADPLSETAYAQLMRLHLRQGDSNAALRTYRAAELALRTGLDVAPGTLLRDLQRQAQSVDGGANVRTPAVVPPRAPAPRDPQFVGRKRELHWLQAEWEQCRTGSARFVVVAGEAGIGKTRLIEEWLARLSAQGAAVAAARCFAGGESLAYAPLVDLLRSSLFTPRLRSLQGVWASEIARLLPELADGGGSVPVPGPLTETWQRQRFLQALTRVVLGAPDADGAGGTDGRGAPQVLLIDDIQWCDAESLGWLAYLMHAATNSPLLVIAAMRSEDLREEAPLSNLLLALQRTGQYAEQTLGPLSAADTAALAANVGGRALTSSEAQELYVNTEGNPLFVVEIVQTWPIAGSLRASPLPPKMQAVVRYRLAQLSPAAQMCVQTAAVAGRDFTLTLLTHAGSQSEAETVMALDELWRRRLVRQMRPEHYEFSHDKLRQVAYEAISPERRRWLHGKVADALVAHDSADLAASAGQIAYHYAQSSQPGRALDHLLLAADAAARIFANREAISFYEKALSLLPPDAARTRTIYEALGELWRRQGKWHESQQAYSTALALIGPEAALARAAVLDKLGRTLIAGHQRVEAWEALTAARRVLEANPDESSPDWCRVWIAVVMGQADWHYWGGSVDEMSDLVAQAEPCVRRFGAPAQQMEWQQLAARAALRRARYIISDAMVEDRRRALEAMRQLGSPAELTVAEFGYAFTLLWNGQVERAGAQFRTALQTARQIGFVFVETQCLTYLAIIARLTGQIGEARTLTLLALQSAQAIQRLDFIGIAHANQAWLAWRTGDLAAARELGAAALDEWDTAATGMPFSWLALWPLIGAALEENRVELALIYARRLLDESQQPPPHPVRTQVSTAMAVWEAGYPTQARAHLEAAAAAAAAIGHL